MFFPAQLVEGKRKEVHEEEEELLSCYTFVYFFSHAGIKLSLSFFSLPLSPFPPLSQPPAKEKKKSCAQLSVAERRIEGKRRWARLCDDWNQQCHEFACGNCAILMINAWIREKMSSATMSAAAGTLGLSKVFILEKYFSELQKFWETEKRSSQQQQQLQLHGESIGLHSPQHTRKTFKYI